MSVRSAGAPLYLDHASILVPRLADAVALLESRLGLHVAVSPAAPHHHGRIYLDRSYLEVSAREPVDQWGLGSFFLRFTDPEALRRHLDAAGIAHHFSVYEGVDGVWDDVAIRDGSIPLPILVRRTHPPEVAADWPPRLPRPHPCSATTLASVVVTTPALPPAVETYARLLGLSADATTLTGRQATLSCASGRIILEEGEPPGLVGILLGVTSVADAVGVVDEVDGSPVVWLDPDLAHGLRIGLTPVAGDRAATKGSPPSH